MLRRLLLTIAAAWYLMVPPSSSLSDPTKPLAALCHWTVLRSYASASKCNDALTQAGRDNQKMLGHDHGRWGTGDALMFYGRCIVDVDAELQCSNPPNSK